MKEKIQLLAAALALILLLCGCAARGTASNDAKPAAGDVTDSNAAPYEVPAFRDSVFNEDEATAFGSGEIDLSQLEGGIIGVKAQSDTRLKMQIVCGEDKYNYDLPNDGTATFFPLNMGNGTYTFRLMEQVGDSKYACIGSEDRDVTLKDEFQPYLRPNQMVNYNKSSDCIKKVKELAASCTTDADIAAAVYDYMVKNIQYDTEKAATVQNGYLPSPDETLKTGKGICFDYASLAAAMLRSEGIPCKLITGYVGEETYHAWNSFYVESEGWITVEIRAKADEWQRVDITFAAGGMPAGEIQNDSEYTTRLLRSGASLSEASSLFEEDGMDTALRQASTEISLSVAAGETFSAAAEKTGVFPEYALSVFSTAELSGRLDEALDRLADHYDRQSALYDRLRSTLTYPAVLMLMMCGVLAVLVFAVLPMFERVYDNLTGSLLSSSYAYVLAATLIGRISLVFAGLLGIVLLILAFGIRSDKGREKLRNTMETSRFTRRAAWLLAVSEVMDTLSALLASGTDEDSALALCIGQTRHKKLHEALEKCREETQMGVGIATAFAHQKILPAMYGKMLLGGAQSGELVQVTENLARRTAQEAENGLCSVIDRTEPILIGFLTASVGLTLLSVMLPLLGILSAI